MRDNVSRIATKGSLGKGDWQGAPLADLAVAPDEKTPS
jgi:hypothetical protein